MPSFRHRLVHTCVLALAVTALAAPAPAQSPVTLRLSTTADLPGLNPLVSDNAQLSDFAELWHGYLLRVDARGRFNPDLATAVPSLANGGISRDGLHVRYRLRANARWQDGAPFDARDVVFSFRAAMNAKNNVPDRSGFDDIADVRAVGRDGVDVRLRRRYSPAVATFFTTGANDPYPILPAHLLASLADVNTAPYNAAPVGLGPYRVTRWERGSRIVLDADPQYHGGRAKIDRIEIAIIPDQNTQLTAFRSGSSDLIAIRGFGATQSALDQARAVAGTTTRLVDHYLFSYVMLNSARKPLDELAVRRAIVRGVDGGRIMRVLRGELNAPGTGDRLPGQFAYDPAIRQAPYDRAAAMAMLDAAGWRMQGNVRMRNGAPLALEITTVAGSSLSQQIGIQLQGALQQLGIVATLKPYPYTMLLESAQNGGIWASGKFDMTYYGWAPGADDDHSYLYRCDTRPPNGENYSRICDPQIDRQAAIALQTSDRATEAAADRAILRRIIDQSYLLFLGFDKEAYVFRTRLHGPDPSVLGRQFWNITSWTLDAR